MINTSRMLVIPARKVCSGRMLRQRYMKATHHFGEDNSIVATRTKVGAAGRDGQLEKRPS